MDRYTYETRCWLELRFHPDAYAHFGKDYEPYQPLFGLDEGAWGPMPFLMASRLARLLANLRALNAESFLDVGGAEGLVAKMAQDELGIPVASVDLSHQAAMRARDFCGVPSAAVDSARLPFKDNAFDVVFLSEVLEHLANPVRSLLELRRVAKRAVIVTTEAFAQDEAERQEELDARELEAHMDRSIFCPQDFDLIFRGFGLARTNQCRLLPDPGPSNVEEAREAMKEFLDADSLDWPAHGIVVVADRQGTPPDAAPFLQRSIDDVARWMAPQERACVPPPTNEVPAELLQRLQCPITGRTDFSFEDPYLVVGDRRFFVDYGAPLLASEPGEAFPQTLAEQIASSFEGEQAPVQELLELDEKLRFDLPEPNHSKVFPASELAEWKVEGEVKLELDGEELSVLSEADDPRLLSPRLQRPMSECSGFAIEIAAPASDRDHEEVQIFWHSLTRPLWWEGASSILRYPADGRFHRLEFRSELARGLETVEGDELLRVRIDPLSGAGRARIRRFELLD